MGFAGRFECSHIHCCCSPVLGMVVPSFPSSSLLPDVGSAEVYQGKRFGSRWDLRLQGEGVSLLTTACFAIQPQGAGGCVTAQWMLSAGLLPAEPAVTHC